MKKSVTTRDPDLPNSPVTEGSHPEEAETSHLTDKPILFFDGVCGLCNSS
ncbi:MAG TPA: thiol-disulfide oxidoreductase, partial [Planctomycetaceae bacterium]|nr:thiol-disulfide oxidoreductase [Planctomycetaceae bacterium]